MTAGPGCDTYLAQMRATIDRLGHVPVESLSPQAREELVTDFGDLRRRTGPTP